MKELVHQVFLTVQRGSPALARRLWQFHLHHRRGGRLALEEHVGVTVHQGTRGGERPGGLW